MEATLELPETFTDFLPIARVKDGRPATEELVWTFTGAVGRVPAFLTIASEWRPTKNAWGKWAEFRVVPIPSALAGRAFRLERDRESVAKDPDGETHYNLLICDKPSGSTCDCKGGEATRTRGLVCRHLAVMTHLLATGRL